MVRIFFIVKRIKTKTTLLLGGKGSLLSLKYCHGSEIIFFHRRHPNGRCCDCLSCCGCCHRLSYGCRHCSCFRNCVLHLMRSFSKASCCGCSCRSTSCLCSRMSWDGCSCCSKSWACCSSRYSRHSMKDAKKRNFADAHTLNWSVRDGCCWARCSSVGCSGWRCWRDGYSRWRCCWKDGCLMFRYLDARWCCR